MSAAMLPYVLAALCVVSVEAQWRIPSSFCNFSRAMRDPDITGWELQLIPPMSMLAPSTQPSRDLVLKKVVSILETTGRKHGMEFEPASLRTSVSSQVSRALSTADGRSLINASASYPWKGPAFLRLREKLAEYRASEGSADLSGAVSVPPGSADLTLKVKDIDPRHIPEGLASAEDHTHPFGQLFTEQLETGKRPHLNVKVENDVYCIYANRVNYEAKWSPVPPSIDVSTIAGVQRFFEHLPRLLDVPAEMELPIYSRREFSKSVWDMEVRGIRGVVNLVLNFPDQESSLAGAGPVKAELSFRLKRRDVEEHWKPGSQHYYSSLEALIDLCNDLHDKGWDEHSDAPSAAAVQSGMVVKNAVKGSQSTMQ